MQFEEIKLRPKTPVLDVVRAVIMDGDKVLLVKEVDDENWKLPGGKTNDGETIIEALERELEEELGIKLNEDNILNYIEARIPDSENFRHMFLLGGIEASDIKETDEVAEAKFFDLDNLPETKFKGHIRSAVEFVTG